MLGLSIWWGCIALEMLLLVRGLRSKLMAHFPVFYSYILFVCLQDLFHYFVYHWRPDLYLLAYWVTEGLAVLIGCGVAFEIYRVGLAAYPGAARMARHALLLVFILVLTKGIVDGSSGSQWWLISTTMDLELRLRTIQAFAIAALVTLFFFYSIPFGRNLRGILLGYGLFIGESVIWLTFAASGGHKFRQIWSHVHPGFYFVILGVWVLHLWSYAPSPEPRRTVQLEQQYQRVAAATSQQLREVRSYLAKAVRP